MSTPDDTKKNALDRALVYAARNGQTVIVKTLLEAGADIHFAGEHPLMIAAQYGQTETVNLLLEAGANPDHEDILFTAWHRAARNGHKDTVKALLQWEDRTLTPSLVPEL